MIDAALSTALRKSVTTDRGSHGPSVAGSYILFYQRTATSPPAAPPTQAASSSAPTSTLPKLIGRLLDGLFVVGRSEGHSEESINHREALPTPADPFGTLLEGMCG